MLTLDERGENKNTTAFPALVFQDYISHPWKPEENTGIPQPVYVSRVGDFLANRDIYAGSYKKNKIFFRRRMAAIRRRFNALLISNADVFEAASPSEISKAIETRRLLFAQGALPC